ncbi:MAG TPA: ATPase, T2SS/T4P/T4SS family [Actinomycetota bacterium]|nr:ATPase, T2SS/T4P/T4SS family [Actinomycetota bacterium]
MITRKGNKNRLQDFVNTGLLTEEQLRIAVAEQKRTKKTVLRVMLEHGFVNEDDIRSISAGWMGFEWVNLNEYEMDPTVRGLIPTAVARRYSALPLASEDGKLVVAMADPTNVIAVDDIRTMTGRDIKIVVAPKSNIEDFLAKGAELDSSVQGLIDEASVEDEPEEELEAADAPVVRLINEIISKAVQSRASDVHVEPAERDVRIRFRIDGVLHQAMRPIQKSLQAHIVSRVKVMADLNIAERRVPQDGRITLKIKDRAVDFRVATLPTAWGEKIVLRILDRASSVMSLQDIGFTDHSFKRFEESFRRAYGALLVTGPTGSGKSTTLYATLNILNDPGKNIITVEDPVEYRLPGLSQVQVNPKAGLNFAGALRSVLRSDPDIIMVGEIRDSETASMAIESALTGHLVLSTLHTNDAPSALTRLSEMGVEPFLVASAIDCVVAQRLARRLCMKCRDPYEPTREALEAARISWPENEPLPTLYRAAGCTACSKTGYRGRVALLEVLTMTEEMERLVVERRSSDEIARLAVAQGMKKLRDDGIEKVVAGLTTMEEILRVVV